MCRIDSYGTQATSARRLTDEMPAVQCPSGCIGYNNNHNLQAFQLIVFARYLLGVPKP